MNHIAILVASVGALALATGLASAESPPPEKPDNSINICDAYGPGYKSIPGTDTCLRVGGSLQFDAIYSPGDSTPGPRVPSHPAK
jgi:hypothetical protein